MSSPRVIEVKKNILAKNDRIAEENRAFLKGKGVTAINFVSSPGAGKTSLLVKTISDIGEKLNIAVIEGDQRTDLDARRIMETGVPVVQLNTGSACHLDAEMTRKALGSVDLAGVDTMFIENIGNLVCPASYDLGEKMKAVLLSVTEGDDKPAKYPKMFRVSSVMIITKIDLLPYVDFDIDRCLDYAKKINPDIQSFQLSVKSREGLDDWCRFLLSNNEK